MARVLGAVLFTFVSLTRSESVSWEWPWWSRKPHSAPKADTQTGMQAHVIEDDGLVKLSARSKEVNLVDQQVRSNGAVDEATTQHGESGDVDVEDQLTKYDNPDGVTFNVMLNSELQEAAGRVVERSFLQQTSVVQPSAPHL